MIDIAPSSLPIAFQTLSWFLTKIYWRGIVVWITPVTGREGGGLVKVVRQVECMCVVLIKFASERDWEKLGWLRVSETL